jgi:hypothetical protein
MMNPSLWTTKPSLWGERRGRRDRARYAAMSLVSKEALQTRGVMLEL